MDYRTISRALAMISLMLGVITASHASAATRTQDHGGRIDVYAERIAAAHGVYRIAGDCFSAADVLVRTAQQELRGPAWDSRHPTGLTAP